jgi:RNA polymerase sigma-70 factor (ECF subfamily)
VDDLGTSQDDKFAGALDAFGPALQRLARGYEADPAERRDLLQNIHLALWRSLAVFDGKCSLRSWVFRVAHNVGASHVLSRKRQNRFQPATLEDLATLPAPTANPEHEAATRDLLARLLHLIQNLRPPDAQVMLLYLEDFSAAEIGEITGLSAVAVATRIHRIRSVLARHINEGTSTHV